MTPGRANPALWRQSSRQSEARPFEHLVLDFLGYLEFERGLSRNTLEAYRTDLLQFGRWLAEHDLSADTVTGAQVSDFVAALAAGNGKPPASPATIHRKAACLRSFYRHLRREGVRDSDPTAAISSPRRGRKLPRVLSRDEVNKLLAAPRGTEPASLRDRALLELMYACGLRASEAIGLELADLDMEEQVLRARGKGSKERVVPVGPRRGRGAAHLPGARPAGARPRAPPSRTCSSTSAAGR